MFQSHGETKQNCFSEPSDTVTGTFQGEIEVQYIDFYLTFLK